MLFISISFNRYFKNKEGFNRKSGLPMFLHDIIKRRLTFGYEEIRRTTLNQEWLVGCHDSGSKAIYQFLQGGAYARWHKFFQSSLGSVGGGHNYMSFILKRLTSIR
jgi:hypothetical protein